MQIKAKNYVPKPWGALDRSVQKRFRQVEQRLREVLDLPQPTYDKLAGFSYEAKVNVKVRKTVASAVSRRAKRSYSMTHEVACFQKVLADGTYRFGRTIFDAASAVRKNLFGSDEPLRTFNMTITYHSKWMYIAPPAHGDPIFFDLGAFSTGSALYDAVNIYLILLTSHPYSDGNGRTARLMFNLQLAEAFGRQVHYVPLSELTRATEGVYEEFIANACRHGDFKQLIWFLLSLLDAYAECLSKPALHEAQSDLAKVMELVTADRSENRSGNINEIPPFPISVQTLSHVEPDIEVNHAFVETAHCIAGELEAYGDIQFALTGLADLAAGVFPKSGAIAFFIFPIQKEDLILRFRELSARYSRKVRLQVVVVSGNPVIDAKILFTLVSGYTGRDSSATSCPILLHDFPRVANGIQKKT